MELPVFIEPLVDRAGYMASLAAPFHLAAEGATVDAAHQLLLTQLQQRLEQGAEVRSIKLLPTTTASTARNRLPDDELTAAWLLEVQRFRAECDAADRARLVTLTASEEPAP